MWTEIRRYLRRYPTAVLTGRDGDGYPISIRCRPQLDETKEVVLVSIPDGCGIERGPASMLCHSHNLLLWNLRSFLLRGTVEPAGHVSLFRPSRFVPGMGVGGVLGLVRFLMAKRGTAGRYLERRGLARPTIAWGQLKAIQARARQQGLSETPPRPDTDH